MRAIQLCNDDPFVREDHVAAWTPSATFIESGAKRCAYSVRLRQEGRANSKLYLRCLVISIVYILARC